MLDLTGFGREHASREVRRKRLPTRAGRGGDPAGGRIAAVADVFEALICDRVHRPAWSVETTVAWMKGERGKHFGPQVFDGFLLSMEEILAVRVDLAVV